MKAKKEVATDKIDRQGGISDDKIVSEISKTVISLLLQQVNSLTSPFDTDAAFQCDRNSEEN